MDVLIGIVVVTGTGCWLLVAGCKLQVTFLGTEIGYKISSPLEKGDRGLLFLCLSY